MTNVLLVDDHELIRQGLARAFERDGSMDVVGQAASVSDALGAWRSLRPDVVVTDLQLPDGTGLDIVRAIRADSAEVGLVMLTMHSGDARSSRPWRPARRRSSTRRLAAARWSVQPPTPPRPRGASSAAADRSGDATCVDRSGAPVPP